MLRLLVRCLAVLLICAGVVWICDFLAVRLPLPPHRAVFSTVKVEQFYQMPLKSGKMEIDFAGYAQQTCVHALAPHFDDPPCWYLTRHVSRVICCAP